QHGDAGCELPHGPPELQHVDGSSVFVLCHEGWVPSVIFVDSCLNYCPRDCITRAGGVLVSGVGHRWNPHPASPFLRLYKITDQSVLVGAALRAAQGRPRMNSRAMGCEETFNCPLAGTAGAARRSTCGGGRRVSSVATDGCGSRSDLVARNFSSGRCLSLLRCPIDLESVNKGEEAGPKGRAEGFSDMSQPCVARITGQCP